MSAIIVTITALGLLIFGGVLSWHGAFLPQTPEATPMSLTLGVTLMVGGLAGMLLASSRWHSCADEEREHEIAIEEVWKTKKPEPEDELA